MNVRVHFYSYFRELTGCADTIVTLAPGGSIAELLKVLWERFPRLAGLERSTLIAVGVEYQRPDYRLHADDEVSLFPPVQGG